MRRLQTLAIMLLASTARIRTCYAFFAPPAQTTSRQNHHHCVLLTESSSQRSSNDAIQSSINNSSSSRQSSSFQSNLNKLLSSALVVTVALTSPINIQITNQHSLSSTIQQITSSSFTNTVANAYTFTENQQFINEIWSAVTSQYYDPSYNNLGMDGWISVKSNALAAVRDTGPDDEDIVNKAINDMLAVLDDPYTRYLSREKYEVLTKYAMGGSSSTDDGGIGVQLLQDLKSGNVVIMGVIDDSPAYKAGLRVGDVIVKINDDLVEEGTSADVVAAKCRGEVGERIELDVARFNDSNDGSTNTRHVSMTRSKITPNPVKATIFASDSNTIVGLLRIPSFTTETVTQIIDGLRSITTTTSNDSKTIDAIAIDLRGNVGGYMPAGVDASKLFLPARSKIIAEIGKSTTPKLYEADGIGAETAIPLYVVVDSRTASASEIFAAALQDNERAVIVGTTNTFGKGRIQNVKPLENGSGLAVTRARYITPNGRDIHGVGIEPNTRPIRCEANDSVKTCLAQIL